MPMDGAKDILAESKICLEKALKTDYPGASLVNGWWSELQQKNLDAIDKFETTEQAVLYAQSTVPFDHRRTGIRSVIDFKLQELENQFPDFSFSSHPELRDSHYCDPATIEDFAGIPYSNIFLYHVNFYLRSSSSFDTEGSIKSLVEIGTGYGGLARIYKIMNPAISYTLIDLPESLFFAQNFLALHFPDAKILYLDDENIGELGEHYDFIFVPLQRSHLLVGQSYDIAINTGSLQEMTGEAVAFWMDFIERQIQVRKFFSCNYFLTMRFPEIGESNLMAPVLDQYWRLNHFRINPEVITIDANHRNWLEVLLERIPEEERDAVAFQKEALAMLEQSKLHTKGSNDWFENIWMSIWRFPTQESITEMLEGIHNFRRGLAGPNLLRPQKADMRRWRRRIIGVLRSIVLGKPFRVLKQLAVFSRGSSIADNNEYKEERFYRNMMANL